MQYNCVFTYRCYAPSRDPLSGLAVQIEAQGGSDPEAKAMVEKLNEIYKLALKRVIKKNMG
jgi:hypothetical protein